MKDVTSTSFGLMIAFLLPGLVGLYGLGYWYEPILEMLNTFRTAESNVGLFLLVLLLSVIIGLELSIFRWLIYEKLVCRQEMLKPEDFKELSDKDNLLSYRAAVDEHYRYHQFWGNISIAFVILAGGLLYKNYNSLTCREVFYATVVFVLVEAPTFWAAREAYIKYVKRGKKILKGE